MLIRSAGLSEGSLEDVRRLLATARLPATEAAARAMVKRASEAGELSVRSDGGFTIGQQRQDDTYRPEGPASVVPPAEQATVRIVAFDLETAVRARIDDGGALTRQIWQIGAVRAGNDLVWVEQDRKFERFTTMSEGYEVPPHMRVEHATAAVSMEAAIADFTRWVAGADVLVAYNGEQLDFAVLDDAIRAAGQEFLEVPRVDGLYLAHCFWPTASSHQLTRLADEVGVSRAGRAHDAVADAVLLAELVVAGAREFTGKDPRLLDLVRSVGENSDAWRMILALCPERRQPNDPASAATISALLEDLLAGQRPRRGPVSAPLAVPTRLLDEQDVVTPTALARALHGSRTEPRLAQEQVAAAITRAARSGRPVLVEAPTGTGKSLSALAAALTWLAADREHRAIISTHTKQLQSQLAWELAQLADGIAGLLDTTDVVKGAGNRLSLRGLVLTLADAAGVPAGAAGQLVRFAEFTRFRELLVFLLLRLVHPDRARTSRWTAHSVDPADLPALFQNYCGRSLPLWLSSLSQAAHGDWQDPGSVPLAAHTDDVREALAIHRLVIANHSLLMAHWPDLKPDAAVTLLIADEAHALEGAATDALSATLSAEDVDDALASLGQLLAGLRPTGMTRDAEASHAEMALWWREGRLRRTLSRVMDARVGQAQVGARTLTLLSPHSGPRSAGDARIIARILREFAGQAGRLLVQLGGLRVAVRDAVDVFDMQRLAAAHQRLDLLRDQAMQLEETLTGLLPPANDSLQVEVADLGEPDDELGPDAQDAVPVQLTMSAVEGQLTLQHERPDRVVYAAETGHLDLRGLAYYRVVVTASPIELPRDTTWREFLDTFGRMALLSATLTVATPGADHWAYLRTRLGIKDADVLELAGPFNYRSQARLVALSDFPSWAEQPRQAMRTVAHQIAGYTREVTRRAEPGTTTPGVDGPWMHGAMVLTTSRRTAGGIADELGLLHAAEGRVVPVHNQVTLGTSRSVADFTGPDPDHGGVLVGTRGLWTGVDVSEPHRNNIVWINKLPFPVFTDPVIAARRESVRQAAEDAGVEDPDWHANATYYLPLAALDLRQAVGRLIRNSGSRGVVVISDGKLAGDLPLRRLYRQVFLGSLDEGLLVPDPDTGEAAGGNVVTMRQAWDTIWRFLADTGVLPRERMAEFTAPTALNRHTLLPATLAIRRLELTDEQVAEHRARGTLEDEVLSRSEQVAGLLAGAPRTLKSEQREVIAAVTAERDSLALLPTGHGKSYCYQLPALVLPGVTVVVSPLVSLMHDQALGLNHTIGGAVRALVASLPESVSRTGRTEVVEALSGDTSHGIKIVYVSPERLTQARFRQALRRGLESGVLRRVAIDEAHTYVQWGDDFRPSFRRVGALLRELRAEFPGRLVVQALTATATPTVEAALKDEVLAGLVPGLDAQVAGGSDDMVVVRANPIRPELTLGRRAYAKGARRSIAALAQQIVDAEAGHTIVYCLTVRETDWLHASLRDHLDGRPVVLRKFHGRLPEVDKAAVSLEFKEAGDVQQGAPRVIVVATSAFGLGVDREDVRTVFCATPPTDLAALYQQLGRGGRDVAGRAVDELDRTTHALAYATNRTLGTAEWMAQLDLEPHLLTRFGHAVLRAARTGHLDTTSVARRLLAQAVELGELTAAQSAEARRVDQWKVGLTRAVATLADLGAVVDAGDVPARVSVGPGTRPPGDELGKAVLAVIEEPTRPGQRPIAQVRTPRCVACSAVDRSGLHPSGDRRGGSGAG